LTIVGASLGGLILLTILAALIIVQTAWFSNFVKNKIISAAEQSTGGVVQIGSFDVDVSHLTIRMRDLVLHGTEPASATPLLSVALIELKLKLFSGLYHLIDLNYLGIQQPRVNLIMMPNGGTNIPHPKVPQPASNNNPLQTVLDLKVNRFDLDNGLINVSQQQTAFDGRGQNLHALLSYDSAHPSYTGNLSIAPLLLTFGNKPPFNVNVNVPVTITENTVEISKASLTTAQSHVQISASLRNVEAPVLAGNVNADVSLAEIQHSIDVPIQANVQGAPKNLTADVAFQFDENANTLELSRANVTLGQTMLQASGRTGRTVNGSIRFQANFALQQLAKLLEVKSVQLAGDLRAEGTASLGAQDSYAVNGNLSSQGLAIGSGTTRVSDVRLTTPFHADPYLISMDGLRLNVLGGTFGAKIFLEKMQQLSVEASLRNFSLPVLASAVAGKQLGYSGTIDGSLNARGALKAAGTTGYAAQAYLNIVPGRSGVPVSGRVNASFVGSKGAVEVGQSYIALPNTRLDLAGTLNKSIDLKLVSHNLDDFLPAINFESTTRESSLPIALHGGTASVTAQIAGNLTNPRIAAQVAVGRFEVQQHRFDQLGLNLTASQFGAAVQNGVLSAQGLETNFAGSVGLVKWKPVPRSPLNADLTMRSGNIADLVALAGESSVEASGQLTADAHIHGTYGDPLGNATLQVLNGSVENQPFSRLYGNVNLAQQLITVSTVELDTAAGSITAHGTFQHPADSFLTGHAQLHLAANNLQLADVKPLQQKQAVAGLIQATADTAADIVKQSQRTEVHVSNVTGDFSASNMKLDNQSAGDLTARARTSNGAVNYDLKSDFGGSSVQVNGQTRLNGDHTTVADMSIQNLSIGKTLEIVGESSVPASGNLSAEAHVAGTLQAPNARLAFTLSRANVYAEPINRLQASIQYSNTLLNISSIELQAPAGSIALSGSFSHAPKDFSSGVLTLKVNSSLIQVSKIEHVASAEPGLQGALQMAADFSARLRREPSGRPVPRFSYLNANASLENVTLNGSALGGASLKANTSGSMMRFQLESNIAASQVRGSGQVQLSGDYLSAGSVTFTNVRYSKLAPLISPGAGTSLPVDAVIEGHASMNGPVLNPTDLTGRLELTRLDVETNPQVTPTGAPPVRRVDLQNRGPIVLTLKNSAIQVQELQIGGPATNISASGGFDLNNQSSPIGLKVAANVDLSVVQDLDKDFYSSGHVTMNATLHGTLSEPLVTGRIELANANLNYINSPNGLSNGNGVILLNGVSATIQSLTGQTGGGTLSLAGFVGFSGRALTFNLKANANKVRVLYSGISVVSNANLALIGTTRRSLLNGTVSVTRISYTSNSDAGSLLSTASTPPSTPSEPSPLLSGLHLDVHILTAPDIRVISTYTQSLDVLANLTLRGTAETPGMLGRVTITNGQLVFFGNTYTVDTGTINFYDPAAIQPILNISLETVAQGVSVTIGVEGPIDDLRLTYRSDPPLTFQQIVALLATNTTPANPVIAAQQPAPPQQSFTQMGESALLGQAVANPIASRVQRVFGLTQLKIDPALTSSTGTSNSLDATVTLQQKVTSNITFTYITDVSQSNGQIIRIEWDLNQKVSAVALHDYNGNVSVEMFYKFKRR
jgi:translocation and assembly module TamB